MKRELWKFGGWGAACLLIITQKHDPNGMHASFARN